MVEVPLGAPTVAVEVLSRDDRRADVDHKIATYLAAGTSAVIVVDPKRETIAVHDRSGARVLSAGETLTHPVLPGFMLDVGAFLEQALR